MTGPERAINLYYVPGTRAVRPRWLLEEIGAPYNLTRLNFRKGEHKKEPFLAINPIGKVPALRDGDTVLTESLAICLHLTDRFPESDLAPKTGTIERAHFYRWMAFSVATLEPAILEQDRRNKWNDEKTDFLPPSPVLTRFELAISVLESALADHPYVLGNKFSAADVMVGSAINWANNCRLIDDQPNTLDWLSRLTVRDAYTRATRD